MLQDKIVTTSKGFLAFWEEGGGMTRSGYAYIVAGPNGEKLTPIYIRKHGSLSCSKHALFLLKTGTLVIAVSKSIRSALTEEERNVYQVKVFEFDNGDFTEIKEENYMQPAIETAKLKTRHYHCRQPLYFIAKEEHAKVNFSPTVKAS